VWTSGLARDRLLPRAIDDATFHLAAFFAILSLARPGDVVLAKTDPPLLCLAAWAAAALRGARLVNWCQDVFPEVAAALGVGYAGGRFGAVLKWLRNRCCSAAAFNAVLSPAMRQVLLAQGVAPDKLRVLPNWCDAALAPVPRAKNPLRAEWGLGERLVIGYSGNLGRAHMPGHIADLVIATRSIPELTWLFIGGGAGIAEVAARAAAAGVEADTIVVRPYQPRERLGRSLSAADIPLISLDPACEGLMLPSKYYGVLAVGRPLLFLGSPAGAIAGDIAAHRLGQVLPSDAPETWHDAVSALADEVRTEPQRLSDAVLRRHQTSSPRLAVDRWIAALRAVEAEGLASDATETLAPETRPGRAELSR
jgi:glycosyltransferase involved in cell wall biosynthesis